MTRNEKMNGGSHTLMHVILRNRSPEILNCIAVRVKTENVVCGEGIFVVLVIESLPAF